jgi:hypothetical protein
MEQEKEPGRSFNESSHRAAAALAQDDVALPVARDGPIVDFGGPLGDHHHVGQTSTLLQPAPGSFGWCARMQASSELTP